jgi:hypothetical protein
MKEKHNNENDFSEIGIPTSIELNHDQNDATDIIRMAQTGIRGRERGDRGIG